MARKGEPSTETEGTHFRVHNMSIKIIFNKSTATGTDIPSTRKAEARGLGVQDLGYTVRLCLKTKTKTAIVTTCIEP